jgi:Fe2+ transport system protein FeoA
MSVTATEPVTNEMPLTRWREGQIAQVARLDLEPGEAMMLRAMGLRPGCLVRLSKVGNPSVVEVISGHTCRCHCRCRIGLARDVASRVMLRAEG